MEPMNLENFLMLDYASLNSISNAQLGYDGSQESADRMSLMLQLHKLFYRKNTSDSIKGTIKSCLQRLFTACTEDANWEKALEDLQIPVESRYLLTVEELSVATGYSVGTIQDFTYQGIIPKPKQRLLQASDTRGLYTKETLELLNHYKFLMSLGRSKEWALARMLERRTEICQ